MSSEEDVEINGDVIINGDLSVRDPEGTELFGVSDRRNRQATENQDRLVFSTGSNQALTIEGDGTLESGFQGSTGMQGIQPVRHEDPTRNVFNDLQDQLKSSRQLNEMLKLNKKEMIDCLKDIKKTNVIDGKLLEWIDNILDRHEKKKEKVKSRYSFINKK